MALASCTPSITAFHATEQGTLEEVVLPPMLTDAVIYRLEAARISLAGWRHVAAVSQSATFVCQLRQVGQDITHPTDTQAMNGNTVNQQGTNLTCN